ncbi:MAG: pyroglutamyl-peptidase I, partial [Micrococcaceae bacterium]|nr:pyroglutamyl-peptidase I [Micrococcaceae bacterium]
MILLTGFEPFGDRGFNPSFAIARQAAAILVDRGVEAVAAQLPCVFATAPAQLDALLERYNPSVVIGLGLAAGRATMALEKVAINHIDARIVDNAGAQPIDVPVWRDGPNAYFSTLPLKAAVQALREPAQDREAIDVNISYTAGSFVCNQMFYSLMHRLERTPG